MEVEITRLLTTELISVGLPGGTKADVLEHLFGMLKGHPGVVDFEEMRRAVLEREGIMSTGVGQGLALPHAKTEAVSDTIAALVVTDSPVDFGSIDGQPVRIVFMLLGTVSARSLHIKVLSRISRLMNRASVRRELMGAESAHAALDVLSAAEEELLEH